MTDLIETVTLSQARAVIEAMSHEQSILLLSPPGVGKSDTVTAAAANAGLECRSLLGTQIAPEDVSGVPRIVGERSVFCPPRVLLPEDARPFCLFLDELPAAAPDIQKAFYSLLLERRIGEFPLPPGTWVVAAGNRSEDRALVRSLSSALVNRVLVLNVRVDNREWLTWATANHVRPEIISFVTFLPEALARPVPDAPRPFSTPRAWFLLSRALDAADRAGIVDPDTRRALAHGRLTAEDAALFSAVMEHQLDTLGDPTDYVRGVRAVPDDVTAAWLVINSVRRVVADGELHANQDEVRDFLQGLPHELAFALLVGQTQQWADLGAAPAMLELLHEVTGL